MLNTDTSNTKLNNLTSIINNHSIKAATIAEAISAVNRLCGDISNALHDDIAKEQLPSFIDVTLIEQLSNAGSFLGELATHHAYNMQEIVAIAGGDAHA